MNRLAFALCLLLAGVLIGLAELPYQWLSELGFRLQRLWPLGGDGALEPLLVIAPALATLLFVLLAWGPLAAGRGGGLTGVLALQTARNDAERERALAPLSLRHQLARLPLLALTHLAGLSVGTESPAAALGAALLLALRRRLAPLQQLPLALTAAIGGGAGLGAAFRSPLLGAAYALEELSAVAGFSLVAPTLVLAGIGTLFTTGLGQPARLAEGVAVALAPELLPLALLITLLAVASGGISLNDGSLALGPALAGTPDGPWWAPLPRVLVGPWLQQLPAEQQAALAGVAAAAVFSGACRAPLFCGLFVFTLQGNAAVLP